MDKLHHASDKTVNKFVREFLRRDGLFIIRLVAKNASDLIAAELIAGLFEHFKDHKRQLERLESQHEMNVLNTENIGESQTWQPKTRNGPNDDDPPNGGPICVITANDSADTTYKDKKPLLQKTPSVDNTEEEPPKPPLPTAPLMPSSFSRLVNKK